GYVAGGAGGVRMLGHATVARTVEQVDRIPLLQVVVRPARLAVAAAQPLQALPPTAVHEHDRVRVPLLRGNRITHEGLFGQHSPTRSSRPLAAHPEPAVVRELHATALPVALGRGPGADQRRAP